MTLSSATSRREGRSTGPWHIYLPTLCFLWAVMLTVTLPVLTVERQSGPLAPTPATVNPNVAPWWELTVLPRIGPGIAHRIVQHRRSGQKVPSSASVNPPVFTCTNDLARVRGIGPKTLRRIGPYLSFEK